MSADSDAVILTNRGKPEFILMTIEEFEALTGKKMGGKRKFCDMVAMQDDIDNDFDPVEHSFEFREADI